MAALDAKKTLKSLLRKGFIESENRSDDHKYLEFWHNNRCVTHTKISHGEKELGAYLIKQMYTQCRINKEQFMDLARCPLSQAEYLQILEAQGLLD